MKNFSEKEAEKVVAICRDTSKPWPLDELVKLGATEDQARQILLATRHTEPE